MNSNLNSRKNIKMAFAGLRHPHIFSLYESAMRREDIKVAAVCEEDNEEREKISAAGKVEITHDNIETMLSEVDCNVVAVGDYYGKRGEIVIKALSKGKHVISDKPICTDLEELDTIEKLCKERNLKVGCMLDMRDLPQFIGVRNIVREGTIGEVHAISFGGQHPLMIGTRPGWYFEPGRHGGTINDIAVHAIDIIPWITGLKFQSLNAARCWNAFAPDYPHFNDAAQLMATLENGCGVLGDVSYFMPDSQGYSLDYYWRITLWGRKGVVETSYLADSISLALNGEKSPKKISLPDADQDGYLNSFINDVAGTPEKGVLTTESIMDVSKISLTIQKAGDEKLRDVIL